MSNAASLGPNPPQQYARIANGYTSGPMPTATRYELLSVSAPSRRSAQRKTSSTISASAVPIAAST